MEIAANQKKILDETKLEAGLNASLELQCRKTMEIGTNTSAQASRQALRASRMEIRAKQYDKEGALFGSQNERKSRRAKMDLPSSRFQPQLLVKSASGTIFDFKRIYFLAFLKHVSFARSPKIDPRQVESSVGKVCLLFVQFRTHK